MLGLSFAPADRQRSARTRRILFWFALGLIAICGGCGKSMRDGFAEAYGTITLDGEPLPNAQIMFETDKGTSYGRTDASGHYTAEYSQSLQGVGTGVAKVRIKTNVVFPGEDVTGLEFDMSINDYRKEELVPAKYNRESELEVEITEGGAPYDFDLTTE